MINTKRLDIFPLSYQQLEFYLQNNGMLEKSLGCNFIQRELDEEFKELIEIDKLPYLSKTGIVNPFKTIWMAKLNSPNLLVADIFFRNIPNEVGSVEIGYSTYPEFRKKGIMTEMVGLFVAWAFEKPIVNIIRAETLDTNMASEKVLSANNFQVFNKKHNVNYWILEKLKNSNTFTK